jgi:hypothetical protein
VFVLFHLLPKNEKIITSTPKLSSAKADNQSSAWMKYTNSAYKYSFMYPQDWKVGPGSTYSNYVLVEKIGFSSGKDYFSSISILVRVDSFDQSSSCWKTDIGCFETSDMTKIAISGKEGFYVDDYIPAEGGKSTTSKLRIVMVRSGDKQFSISQQRVVADEARYLEYFEKFIKLFQLDEEESSSPSTKAERKSGYIVRNFSIDEPFFEREKFPVSLTSLEDYKLLQFHCSKEYISSGNSDKYTHYDLSLQKETTLIERKLLSYLKKITEKYNNPESTIKYFFPSLQYCDIEDGRSIFFYKLGPCGGGCGGIQHIAVLSEAGVIKFDNEISANTEGVPFVGCKLLALVKPSYISNQYESYLLCKGEGYASIENVDLGTNVYGMIKRCQYNTMEANSRYRCWEKDSPEAYKTWDSQ